MYIKKLYLLLNKSKKIKIKNEKKNLIKNINYKNYKLYIKKI